MAQGITSANPHLTAFLKYKNIASLERGFLIDLVDKIVVHIAGEIEISSNFADQHRRIMEFIENPYKDRILLTFFSRNF